MSKNIKYKNVPANKATFGEVYCAPIVDNYRKKLGDLTKLIAALLAYGGWDRNYGIKCELATKAIKERAVKEWTAMWTGYKKRIVEQPDDIATKLKLEIFEHEHLTKGGKIKEPTYQNITGNRRLTALPDVYVGLLTREDGTFGKVSDLDFSLPLCVVENHNGRLTSQERRQEQMVENNNKQTGAEAPSVSENLDAVMGFVTKLGYGQNDVRNKLGLTSTGLRYYFCCTTQMFADRAGWVFNFIKRLCMEAYQLDDDGKRLKGDDDKPIKNPEYLNFKDFNQTAFQGKPGEWAKFPPMGGMCESNDKFDKRNATITVEANKKGDNPVLMTRPTEEELNAWMERFGSGNVGGTPKGMTRDRQINLANNHSTEVVKKIAAGIKDNDDSPISEVSIRESGYNGVFDMSEALFAQMGNALLALSQMDDETSVAIAEKFRLDVEAAEAVIAEAKAKAEAEAEATEAVEAVEAS